MLVVICVYSAFLLLIPSTDAQLQIRLRNGSDPSNGGLEMLYDGTWRTVCVNRLRKQEEHVTCRMLGFNTSQPFTVLMPTFGFNFGYILIENLRCTGEETSLNDCHSTGVNTQAPCFYTAIMYCDSREKRVRLRHSQDIGPNRGHVQIDIGDGQWTTVCVSSNNTAQVVCRQLGLSSS